KSFLIFHAVSLKYWSFQQNQSQKIGESISSPARHETSSHPCPQRIFPFADVTCQVNSLSRQYLPVLERMECVAVAQKLLIQRLLQYSCVLPKPCLKMKGEAQYVSKELFREEKNQISIITLIWLEYCELTSTWSNLSLSEEVVNFTISRCYRVRTVSSVFIDAYSEICTDSTRSSFFRIRRAKDVTVSKNSVFAFKN